MLITRRRALQAAGAGILSSLLLAFASLAGRLAALGHRPRRVLVPADAAGEIVFADEVIVCRTATAVRAFSARCPHMGCQITRQVNGEIVCPCHGSRFRTDGSVAEGPAAHPLEPLPHSIDPATGGVFVNL